MKIRCICLAISLISITVQSQNQPPIDSSAAMLDGKTGTDRIDILYDLSMTLLDINNEEALRLSREAFNLSMWVNDSLRVVRTGRVNGSALWRLQDYISDENHFFGPT